MLPWTISRWSSWLFWSIFWHVIALPKHGQSALNIRQTYTKDCDVRRFSVGIEENSEFSGLDLQMNSRLLCFIIKVLNKKTIVRRLILVTQLTASSANYIKRCPTLLRKILNNYWMRFLFVIPRIIKVEVRVISRSRRLRLITLTEDITKTEFNNCHTKRTNSWHDYPYMTWLPVTLRVLVMIIA